MKTMYSPDISQHTPRLYQLGRVYRMPMTEVARRLIEHGLGHLEEIFGWQPAMGERSPGQVIEEVPVPPEVEAAGK